MIERIHDDGEEYGISPKAGDELQINYELVLKSIYTLNLLKFCCFLTMLVSMSSLVVW